MWDAEREEQIMIKTSYFATQMSDVSEWKADVLCEGISSIYQAHSWPLIARLRKWHSAKYLLSASIS